ncbi:MAG: hypothetical protein ACI83H_002452 [Glaciecola sp.]|jgi:hypothetical protein
MKFIKNYTKPIILLLSIILIQYSYAQEYLNYEKELVINNLKQFGFDNTSGSKHKIIDSSNVVIALFNEDYCSRIEYHLFEEEHGSYCDSIFFTSSCDKCFDVTLVSFLSKKQRKWKKVENNEFLSLRKDIKQITGIGSTREVKYKIAKLKVARNIEDVTAHFIVSEIWVTRNEFRRLRKIKKSKLKP